MRKRITEDREEAKKERKGRMKRKGTKRRKGCRAKKRKVVGEKNVKRCDYVFVIQSRLFTVNGLYRVSDVGNFITNVKLFDFADSNVLL